MLVASLEDLKAVFDDPNARISVQRVKEITRDSGRDPVFPFKAIHERNRSSIENPHQQQLFADAEEKKEGGGSLVEGNSDLQGQTWDPPPSEPTGAQEAVPPVVEELDPNFPRLPPNDERAKGW